MEAFKIIFPSGYQVVNFFNDNIDVNIVFENGKVFFATIFTTSNIKYLIKKDNDFYFWTIDMVIVKDLKKNTIKNAVMKIIADGYFNSIFTEIGTIDSVYDQAKSFDELIDMAV